MFPFALSATPNPPPDPDASVTAMVEQARAGDRAAFTALFHQYNAPICRYLARVVGNDDVGRDLAQETFFAAWRALPDLRDASRFGPWLYRIATNQANSYLRQARVVRWLPWAEPTGPQTESFPTAAGPEGQVGETQQVAAALAQLTPKYRICLLLQLEGGFSQREIARLLHLTEKSISVYVSRGREEFRRAYQRLEDEAIHPMKGRSAR
ncbi:MAG TPA: RNA polymerase sigma factor [Ktedonobacterales bacterium]|nr:RNA polymerase sigma factor [Ktedonobacterales bacterium]